MHTQADQSLVGGIDAPAGLAAALLASLPDCVKVLDPCGGLVSMSRNGLAAMEIDDWESVRGRPWRELWPEVARRTIDEAVATAGAGGSARFAAFCPTARGAPRWWDVTVTPLRDGDGEGGGLGRIAGVVAVSRDVTPQVEAARESEDRRVEAEAALEQTRLLLRELSHRIKNNLALIVSLLRLQMRKTADPATLHALTEAAVRVQTVASVHDRLYRSEAFGTVALDDHLKHLCADLEVAMGGEGRARVETDLAPVEGPVDHAVALGLIVAELVANAHRHARLGPEGRIVVRLAPDGEGRARLAVEDDGAGLPEGFSPHAARGIGLRIVQAKAAEIGASLDWGARTGGGTAIAVAFPCGPPGTTPPG